MRILTLSNTPVTPETGSGYIVCGFAEGLRERGHEVVLRGPAEFTPWPGCGRATPYRQAIGMLRESLGEIRNRTHDIVEFYGAEGWFAISALACLRRRPLLVCHSNGLETHAEEARRRARAQGLPGFHRRWFQLDQSALFARGFRRADSIVTVSAFDRDYALARRYRDEAHVIAIENSLPDEYLGLPVSFERERLLGYCGSWLPRKNTGTLSTDLSRFLLENDSWSLVLAGVGEALRIEDHFPREVIPRIQVVPWAGRSGHLREIYQRIAILVLPSVYESFGLVAAEAMACGCTVVGTRVGFLAALRDNEEAVLMREPMSPHLYDAIGRVARDEALRQRVARGGYRRVQRLRWCEAVETLETTYLAWLAAHRARGLAPAATPTATARS